MELKEERIKSKRKSPNVPGQVLGTLLQPQRLLIRLLKSDSNGESGSIEVLADVGIVNSDGSIIVEECKSTTGKSNPVADTSSNLWKTLYNWILYAREKPDLFKKTSFVIWASGEFSRYEGTLVQNLSDANSPDMVRQVLSDPKEKLFNGDISNAASGIKRYVKHVYTFDQSIVEGIIARFKLEKSAVGIEKEQLDLLKTKFISKSSSEEALVYARGWCVQIIDKIQKGLQGTVSCEEFNAAMTQWARKHDRETILKSYAAEPSEAVMQGQLGQPRSYVQQLEKIDCDDETKIGAIKDFFMAAHDRTVWAEKSVVDEEGLCNFEKGLERHWNSNQHEISIEQDSLDDAKKGQLLLYRCLRHKQALQDYVEIPEYFIPGSFHSLADNLSIGWHPEWEAIFKSPEDDS